MGNSVIPPLSDEELKRQLMQQYGNAQIPGTTGASAIPPLPAPTKQQSAAAGKAEYQRGLPSVTAQPFTPQYFQQEKSVEDYKNAHPWGDSTGVTTHPGFAGKLGHVAAKFGNIAGDIFAPGTLSLIPGTQLNENLKNAQIQRGFDTAQQAATQREAVEQRPEIAELTGELRGQQQAERDAAALERTKEVIAGRASEGEKNREFKGSMGELERENRLAIAEGRPQPTKTIMQGNEAHIMERDPKTGEYSIDRGIAQPNYAQVAPSLRVVPIIDTNPQSPTYGLPIEQTLSGQNIGVSASGGYGHEIAQAGAVARAGNDLIRDLQTPTNREILGQLSSYVKQGTLGTPFADQTAARLSAELKTFAALQPALHGFRARTAQEAFEKIIGGLAQDPDATIAAIQGILQTAGAINPTLNAGGGATPPKGAKVRSYNPDTGKLE